MNAVSVELPPEFDATYYARMRPYIRPMRPLLEAEFALIGKKGGAPGSAFCFRENVAAAFGKAGGSILEIGPGHAPDFCGDNVKYLDMAPQAEIAARFAALPTRNGGAPRIDYLLCQLARGEIEERFDLVYSAHNLEHQVNCVAHINSVSGLLRPGGCFVAIIPDKNYTFDYFRPLSTLVDILSAPEDQTRHVKRTAISSWQTAHNDCARHWIGDHGPCGYTDAAVVEKWRNYEPDGDRMTDFHVNVFEPDSFRDIFGLLAAEGIIQMKLARVYNTPVYRNEFVAIFQKQG